MIRLLRNLLQRALSGHGVCEPAMIEHRQQTACRGDFIGTELSFAADEFGPHVRRRETVQDRFRAAQGSA